MKSITDTTKYTLLGYHDKNVNKVGILEQEKLPILTEESYSPFLITRDHSFVVDTIQIKNIINNNEIIHSFKKAKQSLSTILIIPGVVISLAYALKLFGVFSNIQIAENLLSSNLVNFFFWLAVVGVLVLWHDSFRNRTNPIKLPQSPAISEKELEDIRVNGFRFSRYVELKIVNFLSTDTQTFISEFIKSDGFYTLQLLSKLMTDERIITLIKRANLEFNSETFEKQQINKISIPDYPLAGLRSILIYALEEAILTDSNDIRLEHIFLSYFKVFPVLKKFLQSENSSIELLREIVEYEVAQEKRSQSLLFLDPSVPYYKTGGIAKLWIFGYTFILDHFSKDITQKVSESSEIFGIGHEREVETIVSVVGRLSKKNVLLIGEPGTGKSSLIKGLAQRINRGKVPPQLYNKRIIQLDLSGMIAMGQGQGNLEELIQKAMNELLDSGNTILYIDEIQEIIPAKAQQSGHSIAGIMAPYILDGKFPIIGTVNYADYKKYFYTNESLRQSFENIEVSELSPHDALKILETQIEELETNFGLYITFPALTAAIELSQRYISERKLPDSAVRTLEAACSWAQAQKIKVLTNEHVSKYISIQTSIPVESITAEEATKLMNLEQTVKSKVIGQDEAVHKLVETLKRARTGIRDLNKPIGVFLFLGPTGTGKTHLAKTLSEEYFGTKKDIIKIDMSEYQDIQSIQKFLGASGEQSLYGQSTITLLDRVKGNPFSVVLFDEIEKAHSQVLDLFLQLFDEGHLTSNSGETVKFTNTILICTSNIGSKMLLDSLQKDNSLWEEAKARALIELQQAIRPELLNRFDNVIVFAPHSIQNLIKIANILLNELVKRVSEKGIALDWEDTIPMLIADRAQVPGMGARPLKRFIQEKIEGRIATEILTGNIEAGKTLTIKESWLS
jgi:ATP-dependent Clp protease ATP-binding subunit ClpC